MTKKALLVLTTMGLACALFALTLLACVISPEIAEDWSTDNEEPCCPGDWSTTVIWGGGSITRTNTYVYEGNYSYGHYSGVIDITRLDCTIPITQGVHDSYVLLPVDPGHAGEDQYSFLGAGDNWGDLNWWGGWVIAFNFYAKRAYLVCQACDPNLLFWMGTIRPHVWHHYRVEWNLPPSTEGTGSIQAWMDDVLWVDESNIPMDDPWWFPWLGSYYNIIHGAAGVLGWHPAWGSGYSIYVDDVQIYPCDEPWPEPTPTPTPGVGDCWQYGHAAVLNVSDDECEAVLRFRTLPSYIPAGATVTRATLRIYGIAAEVLGETIYVTPLNVLWGEMTTDWCRRLVGTNWTLPGAYSVPEDREAGAIANFETALGWIDIELPVGLVEKWALTGEANPGLILHNANLTGKFSIASREWHVADYQPHINVWYTE